MKTVGELIRKKRQEAGLSQLAVAKMINKKSGQSVSNWERGQDTVPLKFLAIFAMLFDLDKKKLADIATNEYQTKVYQTLGIGVIDNETQ